MSEEESIEPSKVSQFVEHVNRYLGHTQMGDRNLMHIQRDAHLSNEEWARLIGGSVEPFYEVLKQNKYLGDWNRNRIVFEELMLGVPDARAITRIRIELTERFGVIGNRISKMAQQTAFFYYQYLRTAAGMSAEVTDFDLEGKED